MRSWILTAFFLLPSTVLAAGPPTEIRLRAPESALTAGQRGSLVIELLAEDGRPVPALRDVQVDLKGIGKLSREQRVTLPAGSSRIEVPIQTPQPGLWEIEARAPGLVSGFGVVTCLRERPQPAREIKALQLPPAVEKKIERDLKVAAAKPEGQRRKALDVLMRRTAAEVATIESVAAGDEPDDEPPPPPPPPPLPGAAEVLPHQGKVRLIAQPPRLLRERGGWENSRVDAYWFEGETPELSPRDVILSLVVEQGSGAAVAPTLLNIPTGQFKSAEPALISARQAETAVIRAFYPGGSSEPLQIEFLQSVPARLAFDSQEQTFRGLTEVTTDLFVRLLDDAQVPVIATRDVPVNVVVQGPVGAQSFPTTVPAGSTQAKVSVDLNRPGRYTVRASAPGLADPEPARIRFALDWLLLASSLIGGILGSLTRVLYRREKVWPKGLARVLALGIAAALLVLLLSLFGVLSVLDNVLPAAKALEEVPATNLFGALLLGFIAGMVFDKVLGRFLGGSGGRRAPRSRREKPKEASAT
jgi:hypothetical protein